METSHEQSAHTDENDIKKQPKSPSKEDAKKAKVKEIVGKKQPKVRADVQEKILAYFGAQLQHDRKDVPRDEIAQGCSFANARTHGFFYAWQDLVKNKGYIVTGTGKGCFRLTDAGKDNIPEGVVVKVPKKDNAGMQEFFKKNLLKQCKAAKADKLDIIFGILKDGEAHSLEEFTEATGYANLKSRGLGDPFSWMQKKMNILERGGDKKYQFTDKCFPDGRP